MNTRALRGLLAAPAFPHASTLRTESYTQDSTQSRPNPVDDEAGSQDLWICPATLADEGLDPSDWGPWADDLCYALTEEALWEEDELDRERREAMRAVDRGEWYDDDGGIRP